MTTSVLSVAGPLPRPARRPWRFFGYVAGAALGVAAVVAVLPAVSGATWGAVAATVRDVPLVVLAGLVALWAAGLAANTFTLVAALPGLTHRRAILLSLTGSAVANVLPLGGAAGVALNYRMTRSWGFSPAGFASYTLVTNLWDVAAKLVLPLVLLPLVLAGPSLGHLMTRTETVGAVGLPLVAGLAALLLARPGPLRRLGGRGGGRVAARLERVRATAAAVVRTAWPRLTLGVGVYTVLLLVLLVACLHATGAGVPLWLVLPAFCTERVATLAGITPGGLGVVEVGLAAVLMAVPGASAAGVASGVLLYRAFTFGLEIPVGGVLLAGWSWLHRVRRA